MQQKLLHSVLLVLCILSLSFFKVDAQVVLGDGVTISKGTSFVVKNQEVKIATSEIKGEGNLIVSHTATQKITVAKELHTGITISVKSQKVDLLGDGKQYFALHHLPSFSNEIIAAKKEIQSKRKLPIRYLNAEGKSFLIDKEDDTPIVHKKNIKRKSKTDVAFIQLIPFKATSFIPTDYSIPIYSVLLNNERILSNAKLYEFECLTALLKPPIV